MSNMAKKLKTYNALLKDYTNPEDVELAFDEVEKELDGKQDLLTAGDNITIIDNVISATSSGGETLWEQKGDNVELKVQAGLRLQTPLEITADKSKPDARVLSVDSTGAIIGNILGHPLASITNSITFFDNDFNPLVKFSPLTKQFTYKDSEIANKDDLATKQDSLVSGTNIKTINSESLLGSGNIDISGGESLWQDNGTFASLKEPRSIDMKTYSIKNLRDPIDDNDGATKKYVDEHSGGSDNFDENLKNNGSVVDYKIQPADNWYAETSLVTKKYVDEHAGGTSPLDSVLDTQRLPNGDMFVKYQNKQENNSWNNASDDTLISKNAMLTGQIKQGSLNIIDVNSPEKSIMKVSEGSGQFTWTSTYGDRNDTILQSYPQNDNNFDVFGRDGTNLLEINRQNNTVKYKGSEINAGGENLWEYDGTFAKLKNKTSITMQGLGITALRSPTLDGDAVNKQYVDSKISADEFSVNLQNLGNQVQYKTATTPQTNNSLVTKKYVDDKIVSPWIQGEYKWMPLNTTSMPSGWKKVNNPSVEADYLFIPFGGASEEIFTGKIATDDTKGLFNTWALAFWQYDPDNQYSDLPDVVYVGDESWKNFESTRQEMIDKYNLAPISLEQILAWTEPKEENDA